VTIDEVMDASPAPDLGATLLSLYDEALPAVYGYVRRRVQTDAIAQDLTSETFLAAVKSIHGAKTSHVSVAWLIGIARHKLLDHFRRAGREERNLQLVASTLATTAEHWDVTLREDLTSAALNELGPNHRSALTFRHLDGLSVPEVAQLLGRTVHATEALLTRARVAFRASYEAQLEGFSND
jgi:RNA polymerase sigma-70 factor, ECF subfamily